MRNLKRALSLTLASVMLLGMMVIGTSAASFSDVSDENNSEAIEVLQMVGVLNGYEDGTFRPDQPVTRNEMAVIMASLLGVSLNSAIGNCPFDDVPTWAQPAVGACVANGIVNGKGPGIYDGASTVTAIEAGAMMLRALGYTRVDADDDWTRPWANLANKINLFDGLTVTNSTPMTRNNVAQLALNTLQATMVTVDWGFTSPTGSVVAQITYSRRPAGNYDFDNSGDGVLQMAEWLYKDNLVLTYDSYEPDFHRPADRWYYRGDTVYAVENPTYTYTAKVGQKALRDTVGSTVAGSRYTWNYSVDGGTVTTNSGYPWSSSSTDSILDSAGNKVTGNGVLTEVYVDHVNRTVDVVVINTYLAKVDADYDATDKELDISVVTGDINLKSSVLKSEDYTNLSGYREDDYVLITATNNGSDYSVVTLEPADVVSDVKVGAYKANDYVTAGTKYSYAQIAKTGVTSNVEGYDLIGATLGSEYSLQGSTYDLILDKNGYVIGAKLHSSEAQLTDYLFLKDAATSGFNVLGKAVFMDGTSKTITVAKVKGHGGTMTSTNSSSVVSTDPTTTALAVGEVAKGGFYTYTVNKSGDYELTQVDPARQQKIADPNAATGDVVVNPSATNANVTGSGWAANNSTVFVAKDKAFVGVKNTPKVLDGDVYALRSVTGSYLLAAYSTNKGVATASAAEYVYILNKDSIGHGMDGSDNRYYTYDAVVNGKKTTIDVTNSSLPATGVYKIDSYTESYPDLGSRDDGIGAEVVYAPGLAQSALGHRNGTVTVSGTGYVLKDDAKLVYIDATDSNATRTISGSYLNNLKTGTYDIRLIQASATDHEVISVYVTRLA